MKKIYNNQTIVWEKINEDEVSNDIIECEIKNWLSQEREGEIGDFVPYSHEEQVFENYEFCLVCQDYDKLNKENKKLIGTTAITEILREYFKVSFKNSCCYLIKVNNQNLSIRIDGWDNI